MTTAFVLALATLPFSAQAATVGSSAPGEVPQITEFEVAPSSEQAGANIELNIHLRLCDAGNIAPHFGCTDAQRQLNTLIKQFTLSFPPGLRGNPNAVTPCPVELWEASTCPPDSVVGSSLAMATFLSGNFPNTPAIPIPTPLYVVAPSASEPARLGTALLPASPAGPIPIVISVRADGGIDAIVDNLPHTTGGLAAKLFTIDTTLCRLAPCDPVTHQPLGPDARPFMVNPPTCDPATSRIVASPWPPPTGVPPPGPPSHAESTFTPTGCSVPPNCRPKRAKLRGRAARDHKKLKRCRGRDRGDDRHDDD